MAVPSSLLRAVPRDPTIISLVASNLITLFLALLEGWNFSTILWIYWCQSVIIGLFSFFKILNQTNFSTENFSINDRTIQPTKSTLFQLAVFFAVHYGFFHLIYALFLSDFLMGIDIFSVLLAAAIFFFNHFISYRFYGTKLKKRQNIGTVMFMPYARIVPMHLIILLAGPFINVLSPIYLAFFLLMKTGADVMMHSVEHHGQWEPAG